MTKHFLLSDVIRSKAKYVVRNDNFIDVLQKTHNVLYTQDRFYDIYIPPETYPGLTIWDDSFWKNANEAITHALGNIKGKLILDLGSGIGEDTQYLLKKGARVVSLDSSEKCLLFSQRANKNLHIRADATDLSFFKAKSFDIVFGREVLHHVDTDKCLMEVQRILKNKGFAVFQESLKYNLLIAVYRILKKKERVPQHPFSPNELSCIAKKYFRNLETKFLYTLLPMLYIIKVFIPQKTKKASSLYNTFFSKIDLSLSNKVPFFAWEEIITMSNKSTVHLL